MTRLLDAAAFAAAEWRFARTRGLGLRASARAAWSGAVYAWEAP